MGTGYFMKIQLSESSENEFVFKWTSWADCFAKILLFLWTFLLILYCFKLILYAAQNHDRIKILNLQTNNFRLTNNVVYMSFLNSSLWVYDQGFETGYSLSLMILCTLSLSLIISFKIGCVLTHIYTTFSKKKGKQSMPIHIKLWGDTEENIS